MPTPMMRQYRETKAAHPDALLLFRLGDFYELFFDDAKEAARLLGITLTAREKEGERIPMAGVPHHAAQGYIRKLLALGRKVAVCDQVEDPSSAKGIVRREVTQVVTPGTVTEEGFLEAGRENLLAAVAPDGGAVGIAWVDLSTGRFETSEVPAAEAASEILRHAPAELLLADAFRGGLPDGWGAEIGRALDGRLTHRPDWLFEPDAAARALREHFGVETLDGFGLAGMKAGLGAAAAILDYLRETQKAPMGHLTSLSRFAREDHLAIDPAAQKGLELLESARDGSRAGTLLSVLDRTRTGMGARLLRWWLMHPLKEAAAIEARLDAVEALAADHRLRKALAERVSGISDLERLASRLATARATPRELSGLRSSLRQVPLVREAIAGAKRLSALAERIDPLDDLRGALEKALADDPPHVVTEGGIFRDGFDAELDDLRGLLRDGKGWLARFQAQEAARSGIPSLKVGYNRVFGYYIEVTAAHYGKVPADYVRKQTLKGCERFITEALKEQEGKVLSAQDRSRAWEQDRFIRLRADLAGFVPRLLATGRALAELDCLAGLATAAVENRYVRPRFVMEPVIRAKGLRHPVIEARPGESFVPNDLSIDGETRLLMITGPNMAGKSTYIRQAALLSVMAQIGSFVAADSAELGVVDRLFARIGAGDDISRGQSTFMVEMSEAARILHQATERSLVVLDEIGRGTSTYDGVSLAWAIAERLARDARARTLFATHYHELAALSRELASVRNLNVLVKEERGEVRFLHRVVEGSTDRSYGIHVAQLAGVPAAVLVRAREILGLLESRREAQVGEVAHAPAAPSVTADDPIRRAIRDAELESMTPLQALNFLQELKLAASRDKPVGAKLASPSVRPKKRSAASPKEGPTLF